MRSAGLGFLALAAFAAGCLAFGDVDGPAPEGPEGPTPLVASLTAQPHACSLCHYAWDVPLTFNGTVEKAGSGFRYAFTLAPSAAYNLTDVRVVPVVDGSETASLVRLPASNTVARGQQAVTIVHLPEDASALHVVLTPEREFTRSSLSLTIHGEDASVSGIGLGAVRAATFTPAPAGMYAIAVRYDDGTPLDEGYRLLSDAAPSRARVVAEASREAPARFEFILPEKPRGFVVQARPMNEHPTGKWYLPNWADRGELALFVGEGEPQAPRSWTPAEIDALWEGSKERVFHDSQQDGILVRTQDGRGEWTRQSRWFTPPPEEAPFPPLLPGTREVLAEITWSARTPLSPAPTPYFSWANGLGPTFFYPEPTADTAGRRTYVVPVEPSWWQAPGETGGFQAFALLPLDERSTTVFDGTYGIRLTMRR